ncbi:hypothetical protein ACQB60_20265 [Actinomycetota bacterium Odt1-20B]
MKATLRSRCARAVVIGALTAGLATAGTVSAFADANAPAQPVKASSTPSPSKSATKGSLTIKADKNKVKAGESVHFSGSTKGVKQGSKVVLQHKTKGKWTTLHANTTVKKNNTYALDAKLNTKGKETLRAKDGDAVSPTVTVTVS